jgi:adenylate kinase
MCLKNIIIVGPQGSGKGTQAQIISDKFSIPAISMGDILRENIQGKTALGQKISEYTDKGELVPDELIYSLLEDRFSKEDVKNGFILDGFPRNEAQVELLDRIFEKFNLSIDTVLEFTADKEELVTRMLKRAEIEGRIDDTPEIIQRRLDIYYSTTQPIVSEYANRNVLFKVDAVGTIDSIADKINVHLNKSSSK